MSIEFKRPHKGRARLNPHGQDRNLEKRLDRIGCGSASAFHSLNGKPAQSQQTWVSPCVDRGTLVC